MAQRQLYYIRRQQARRSVLSVPFLDYMLTRLHKIGQPSQNKIITFADGSYIELFNWYSQPPAGDDWSGKDPGLVDWAISSSASISSEDHFRGVSSRLQSDNCTGDGQLGVSYPDTVEGGRKLPDGKIVRWKVSGPEFKESEKTPDRSLFPKGRLDAPFLIYDITPRKIRLPMEDTQWTTHPCGALGVKEVQVLVPLDRLENYETLYSNILGAKKTAVESGSALVIETPVGENAVQIRIDSPDNQEDMEWVRTRGIGLSAIRLQVQGRKGHGREALGGNGSASRISLIW